MSSLKNNRVRGSVPSRSIERELSGFMLGYWKNLNKMVLQEFQRYLTEKTIEKFTDEEPITSDLINDMFQGVLINFDKKYSKVKVEEFLAKNFKKADKRGQRLWFEQMEKVLGIPYSQLVARDLKSKTFDSLVNESLGWVEKLRDDSLKKYSATSLNAILRGLTPEEVLVQLKDEMIVGSKHAEAVGRAQLQNFNSLMNDARAKDAGAKMGTWKTSGDDNVRPSHRDRNGRKFELAKGCYSSLDKKYLFTGEDYECRCITEYELPSIDEIYQD